MTKKQVRQQSVIERLNAQLTSGVKRLADGSASVPLLEGDIKRIKKEIVTLKSRL